MPFLAEHPDTGMALRPKDVGEKFRRRQTLACPYCGDAVSYRKQGTDDDGNRVFRAHFVHSDNLGGNGSAGGCSRAGESPEHEKWKMVIGELLADGYQKAGFEVEKNIGPRVADVAIKSSAGRKRGIVAEYQHKNKGKDYLKATKDYLKHGYGVHWIFNTSDDYEMLYTAKEEINRFCVSPVYLGEKNAKIDGFVDLGDQIWFGNFEFVVTSPRDIGPFVPRGTYENGEMSLWSGEFVAHSGGRVRHPYLIGPGPGDQEDLPPAKVVTTDDWDWSDVMDTYYADNGGAGLLHHFEDSIKSGQFIRKAPIPEQSEKRYTPEQSAK